MSKIMQFLKNKTNTFVLIYIEFKLTIAELFCRNFDLTIED